MQRTLKLFKLPENTKVPGFRKLVEADIPQAHKILTEVIIFARIYIVINILIRRKERRRRKYYIFVYILVFGKIRFGPNLLDRGVSALVPSAIRNY